MIVTKALAAGDRVAVWDRDPRQFEDLRTEWLQWDDQVQLRAVDITDQAAVEEACQQAREAFGPVDVLVNTAGLGQHAEFLETSSNEWSDIVRVNLIGPSQCIRAVLPEMLNRGQGVIINICSIWSRHTHTKRSAYIASKWGLLALSECLSKEYRTRGIRVVAVSPGPVMTPMTETMVGNANLEGWMLPADISDVVQFLVRPEGRAIVGSEVQVYGWGRPEGLQ